MRTSAHPFWVLLTNTPDKIRLTEDKFYLFKRNKVIWMTLWYIFTVPGHQPEMLDLFLRDAMDFGFLTDCHLKRIDWRFLCKNFLNLGQVVWILRNCKENSSYLPQTTFSLKMKELGTSLCSLFCNILIQGHKVGLEWKMNWPTYELI